MYNEDIYMSINQNISDPNTLVAACNTNKTMRRVCATRYFWEPLFIKNNLPLPNVIYTTTNDWLQEYNKTYNAMETVIDVIDFLPNKLYTTKNYNFMFFKDLCVNLDIKPYYDPQYLADLTADGFTPHNLDETFDDFGNLMIKRIKFYIEDGLYIINFYFDTDDVEFLYGNYKQIRDFLFTCFYNNYFKFSLSPVNSPRRYNDYF